MSNFVLFGFKPIVATPSKTEGLNFAGLHAALNSSIVLVNADPFISCSCAQSAIVFLETFVT